MSIDVEDFGWMLTVKPSVDIDGNSTIIPFEISFSGDDEVEVLIDWVEWNTQMGISPTDQLAHLPPAGKVREAASKAAEHLSASGDPRLATAGASIREYGEEYTTTKGRTERGRQIG